MSHKNLFLVVAINALCTISTPLLSYPRTALTVKNNSDKVIDFLILRFGNRYGNIHESLKPGESKTIEHLGNPVKSISHITYSYRRVPYDPLTHLFVQPTQDAKGNIIPQMVTVSDATAHETLYFSDEDPDYLTIAYDGKKWLKIPSYTQYIYEALLKGKSAASQQLSQTKSWFSQWMQKIYGTR